MTPFGIVQHDGRSSLQSQLPAANFGRDGAVGFNGYHKATVELQQEAALATEPHIGPTIAVEIDFRSHATRRRPANVQIA
jgi:hypothetical protein